jgi:hypothetical protein
MAGLNHQVRGELDHTQGLRAAQNALLFRSQDEKSDLGQESDAHNGDHEEHVARQSDTSAVRPCIARDRENLREGRRPELA